MLHHCGCNLAPAVRADERGDPKRQTQVEKQACDCVSLCRWERYTKRNRDTLSTTSNKYSSPASGLLWILFRSTSKTSHGSKYLAGSIAMRWLRDRFLRGHPQDKTYALESLHIPGQWKRSRSSENVLPTLGCLLWQFTKPSEFGTKPRGTAEPTFASLGFHAALTCTTLGPGHRGNTSLPLFHLTALSPSSRSRHQAPP